jgi:hypothetical protein
VAGNAELTHDEHVERSTQSISHLRRNRHAPAGQAQYHHVIAAYIVAQLSCETATRIMAVGEVGFVDDGLRVGADAR